MVERDFEVFAEAFGAAWDFHKPLSDRAMAKAFQVLAKYPVAMVLASIDAHCADRSRGQFPPKPADLIDQIERRNPDAQRPGADEAWARMPRSEDDSVVWTEEMCAAWAVASALVNPCLVEKPDWVAARMAFKDAYQRAVDTATVRGVPVRWVVSEGSDKQQLADVVREAVRSGLLSHESARPYLLTADSATAGIAGLLEGAKAIGNAQALEAIAALKGLLRQPPPDYDLDAVRAECETRDRALDARLTQQADHA